MQYTYRWILQYYIIIERQSFVYDCATGYLSRLCQGGWYSHVFSVLCFIVSLIFLKLPSVGFFKALMWENSIENLLLLGNVSHFKLNFFLDTEIINSRGFSFNMSCRKILDSYLSMDTVCSYIWKIFLLKEPKCWLSHDYTSG